MTFSILPTEEDKLGVRDGGERVRGWTTIAADHVSNQQAIFIIWMKLGSTAMWDSSNWRMYSSVVD